MHECMNPLGCRLSTGQVNHSYCPVCLKRVTERGNPVDRMSPEAAKAKMKEEDFDLDPPETEAPVYCERIHANQMIIEFGNVLDRGNAYEEMLRQEGCIGGRELDPTPLNPTWRIQGFFEDTSHGINADRLPDGFRGVIIPRSLQVTLGIRDSAFKVEK